MSWIKYTIATILVLGAGVYFGLPPALQAMGLHQHYEIPKFDLAGKRALVVTTSHGTLGDTGKATGVAASEMTIPYYAFLDAGMMVDLASIKGGEIPVEPMTTRWPIATADDRRFLADPAAMKKLKNSIPIAEIDAKDYDVIFMAGGWGASYDLAQSSRTRRSHHQGQRRWQNHRVRSGHGALGLVNAKDVDGTPLLEGRRVTGVTDKQIKELGISITPKHPETELRAAKARFEAQTAWRDFFATHTVVDGNLVTGQNQNSGYETSHRILELLAAK